MRGTASDAMTPSTITRMLMPAALLLSGLAACARMSAPGGGPEDTTPPELVSTDPLAGPGQPGTRIISLTFSERLNPATVDLPLYPPLDHRTKCRGSVLEIELAEPLGGRTVVVHVPAGVSDLRGNRLESALDLVYSGSDSLGTSSVSLLLTRQGGGMLFSGDVVVEIYDPDATLLRRSGPDSTGAVSVRWLEAGDYRLLCYEDTDLSFTWEPESEAGFDSTFRLDSDTELLLNPVLTVVDTVGPALVDVQAMDSWHIGVLFGEEVSRESLSGARFLLTDADGDTIGIDGWWIAGGGRGLNGPVLTTSRATGDSTLVLRISGVADLLGNVALPDSMEIWGVDSLPADSLRVAGTYPEAGAENVPAGGPFTVGFNYWVPASDVESRFTLTNVSEGATVPGSLVQASGRAFDFVPFHQLMGGVQYRMDLAPGITTAWGDTLEAFSLTFTSAWGNEPGAISGTISGIYGRAVVQVSHAGESGEPIFHSAGPGRWLLEDVPAGRYTVAAFSDADGDGEWRPGEPYGAYPGVITVYPGMVTEEVDIEILP